MINIRPEKFEDYRQISLVIRKAFNQEDEVRLVEELRKTPFFVPELSIVAELNGLVVGHILFTKVIIKSETREIPALTLAPLAITPEHQNQGIGSQLVRKGLEECKLLNYGIVTVLGHPNYYPRFGFKSAQGYGIQYPFEVPTEAFMIQEIIAGALKSVHGVLIYSAPFSLV